MDQNYFSTNIIGDFQDQAIRQDEIMEKSKEDVQTKLARWFIHEKEKLAIYVSGSSQIWGLINEWKEDLLDNVLKDIDSQVSEIQVKKQQNKKAITNNLKISRRALKTNWFSFNLARQLLINDIEARNINYDMEMKLDLQDWNEESVDK